MARGFNGPPSTRDVGGIDHPDSDPRDAWGFYERITPDEAYAPAIARARASTASDPLSRFDGTRWVRDLDNDLADPFGRCKHGVYNATPCPDCTEEAR